MAKNIEHELDAWQLARKEQVRDIRIHITRKALMAIIKLAKLRISQLSGVE